MSYNKSCRSKGWNNKTSGESLVVSFLVTSYQMILHAPHDQVGYVPCVPCADRRICKCFLFLGILYITLSNFLDPAKISFAMTFLVLFERHNRRKLPKGKQRRKFGEVAVGNGDPTETSINSLRNLYVMRKTGGYLHKPGSQNLRLTK